MTIWLNVEIAPGSNIESTARETVQLANRLDVDVWFEFNGVKCGARPGDDPKKLVEAFHREIQSDRPHRIAVGN